MAELDSSGYSFKTPPTKEETQKFEYVAFDYIADNPGYIAPGNFNAFTGIYWARNGDTNWNAALDAQISNATFTLEKTSTPVETPTVDETAYLNKNAPAGESLVLSSLYDPVYWAKANNKIVTIDASVTIGSLSTSSPALSTGTGFGGTLTIKNYGKIYGAGGESGLDGGTAILVQQNNVVIENHGEIYGGGGGGGTGGTGGSGGNGGSGTGWHEYLNTSNNQLLMPLWTVTTSDLDPWSTNNQVELYVYNWANSPSDQGITITNQKTHATRFTLSGHYDYDGTGALTGIANFTEQFNLAGGATSRNFIDTLTNYLNAGGTDYTVCYGIRNLATNNKIYLGEAGGAGGTGGAGGRGQGYNHPRSLGSLGSAGSAGASATANNGSGGTGGTGGAGGDGGQYGQSGSTGATGSTGSTGSNGDRSSGVTGNTGTTGTVGANSGFYIDATGFTTILYNTGTVGGRTSGTIN